MSSCWTSCCSHKALSIISGVVLVIGVTLMGLAVFLPGLIQTKLNQGVNDLVYLTKDSQTQNTQGWRLWADWRDSDAPVVYFNVHMYNVTNHEDVLKGATPNIADIGPYVYREYKVRINVSFVEDNNGRTGIRYRTWKYFVFDREQTPRHLSESDIFVVPNMVFQAFMSINPELAFLLFGPLPEMKRLYMTRPVSDLLWGFKDPVALFDFPGFIRNTTSPSDKDMKDCPAPGYDYIYTGSATPEHHLARQFFKWQDYAYSYRPTSPLDATPRLVWKSALANRVVGTDGTQFTPGVVRGQPLPVFVDDLCRPVTLEQYGDSMLNVRGVDLFSYRIPLTAMANSTVNPDNGDYFMDLTQGVLNITACSQGIPLFITKPHFYQVEPPLSNSVTGFSPDPARHETVLGVEPVSGATLYARKRLQFNVLLSPLHFKAQNVTWFQHLHTVFDRGMIHPLVFVEESAELTDDQSSAFRGQVYFAQKLMYYSQLAGFIVGAVLAVLAFVIAMLALMQKPQFANQTWSDGWSDSQVQDRLLGSRPTQ